MLSCHQSIQYYLTNLKPKIFNTNEQSALNTVSIRQQTGGSTQTSVDSNFFVFSCGISGENFVFSSHFPTDNTRKACNTACLEGGTTNPTTANGYWLRTAYNGLCFFVDGSGLPQSNGTGLKGIRPMFVISL